MDIFLVPHPKKVIKKNGVFSLESNGYISIDNKSLFQTIRIAKEKHFSKYQIVLSPYFKKVDIKVLRVSTIPNEGYELKISEEGIEINYSDPAGVFYAFVTLNQLRTQTSELPYVEICDSPDFPIRGYMWDVARCKIPKLTTILDMVDRLATFKINHLELYMEGAPFEYSSYPKMWEGTEVLTGEELMIIDEYCKERFIDFVPTHNTFGHMGEWLKNMPRDMAICPDGFYYEPWDMHSPGPSSLNPFNPKSIEFVREISDDLIKHFSSNKFNVCCDEVLELGSGTTEGLNHYELGKTYFDFLMKIYDYCNERGKKHFFWGDMIGEYPEFIKELPKDIMALNWGYAEYEPTEESCINFEKAGIPYCVAPGTGAWKTFTGKTQQMKENINGAVKKGLSHGASGVILTDWGDNGHLQGWATVLPGLVYAAALSWNYEDNVSLNIAQALNRYIYGTVGVGEFSLEVGNYHTMEPISLKNQTVSEKLLFNAPDCLKLSGIDCLWECISHELMDSIISYMDTCYEKLKGLDFKNVPDGENIRDEYAVGIETVKLAQMCGHYKLYIHEDNKEDQKNTLGYMINVLPKIISEYERTWLVKNKYSRFDDAIYPLKNLYEQLKRKFSEIN